MKLNKEESSAVRAAFLELDGMTHTEFPELKETQAYRALKNLAQRGRLLGAGDQLVVIGTRWFDGEATYHSVQIFINSDDMAYIGKTYGYERHYLTTAGAWLHAAGYIYEDRPLFRLADEWGFKLLDLAVDVDKEDRL